MTNDNDIRQLLHTIAEPATHHRQQIRNHVLSKVTKSRSNRQRFPIRTAIASFILVMMSVFSVLAYWSYDDGLRNVVENNLLTTIDQTQVIGETTVTLQWAYADASRVVVSYTADTEEVDVWQDIRITSPSGYPMGRYGRWVYQLSGDEPGQTQTVLSAYQPLSGDLDAVPLRLQITVPGGRADFHFEVPLYDGNRFTIEQTQTINDQSLTLTSMFATPANTMIDVCFTSPIPLDEISSGGWWILEGELQIEDSIYTWNQNPVYATDPILKSNYFHVDSQSNTFCSVLSFPVTRSDTFTLTVDRIWLSESFVTETAADMAADMIVPGGPFASGQVVVEGPWIFTVETEKE